MTQNTEEKISKKQKALIAKLQKTKLALMSEMKSEVNLLKFPFFLLSKKADRMSVIEYSDVLTKGDAKINFLWKVIPSIECGLPSVFDKKVFRAIEQIVNQMGWTDAGIQNPISFSLYEICKIIDIEPSGKSMDEIKESIKRIISTSIQSKGAFYIKAKKEGLFEDTTFHLYDLVIFKNKELPDGSKAETNYLYLGKYYLESLNSFYVKKIDYAYYQSLKSDIARRLYEILDIKFYGLKQNKKKSIVFNYQKLCSLLPIEQQKYLSLAKQTLQPAHNELIETDFLKSADWNIVKNEWQIEYTPSKKIMGKISSDKEISFFIDLEKQKIMDDWVKELANRGVMRSQAVKLLKEYQERYPEGNVGLVVACFDHKNELGHFKNIENKAALLVTMIQNNEWNFSWEESRKK